MNLLESLEMQESGSGDKSSAESWVVAELYHGVEAPEKQGQGYPWLPSDTQFTSKSSSPLSGFQAAILQAGSEVDPQEMEPHHIGAPTAHQPPQVPMGTSPIWGL